MARLLADMGRQPPRPRLRRPASLERCSRSFFPGAMAAPNALGLRPLYADGLGERHLRPLRGTTIQGAGVRHRGGTCGSSGGCRGQSVAGSSSQTRKNLALCVGECRGAGVIAEQSVPASGWLVQPCVEWQASPNPRGTVCRLRLPLHEAAMVPACCWRRPMWVVVTMVCPQPCPSGDAPTTVVDGWRPCEACVTGNGGPSGVSVIESPGPVGLASFGSHDECGRRPQHISALRV